MAELQFDKHPLIVSKHMSPQSTNDQQVKQPVVTIALLRAFQHLGRVCRPANSTAGLLDIMVMGTLQQEGKGKQAAGGQGDDKPQYKLDSQPAGMMQGNSDDMRLSACGSYNPAAWCIVCDCRFVAAWQFAG